ncbi:putative NAD-specific glutamate dehydrogenase [Roseivivax marinus]|uniref:Putative NAD-specific glutamate dehydrogenase n=1 Tax=Roseivivax marinus TaxID=1379903 RepID=W4HIB0_9RHOB|nr:putative NAD-specific glutamate dehydrogenase [Roseivivax marinus]
MRRPAGSGPLAVVEILEIRIDDVVVTRRGVLRLIVGVGIGIAGAVIGLRLVDRLAQLHRGFGDVLDTRADFLRIVVLQFVLQRGDGQLDCLDRRGIDLVAMLFHRLLGRVDQAFRLVAGIDQIAALLVRLGVFLGILHHLLDIGFRQTAGGLDGDLLLLVGALVLGANVDDAVRVDVERHLDLGHAARCRRNVLEVELAEHLVVGRHLALTLEDPDRHGVLVVLGGREDLRLLGRDRRVAVDQAGEHAAQRLDAQRQRGHVEKNHVLHVTLQNACLDRGAHGDDLVRVHALVRLLAEELGDLFDHLRHPRLTTNEHDFVDVVGREAGIFQRRLARLDGALDEVAHEAFQLRTGQLHDHVQRLAVGAHRDERLVDLGLAGRGQLDLRLLGRFLQALKRHLVLREIDLVLFFELVREVVDDPHVEVFTAEERVTVRRLHLEKAVVDLEDGHVERAAAEVVDRDRLALFLVEAIGQSGRGRLVDDAQDFEARDLAGVLGGLTLLVVEVRGHGDDRLRHFLAEVALGGFLHLLQDEGRDLRRRIGFALGLDPRITVAAVDDLVRHVLLVLGEIGVVLTTTDQALDAEDGVGRVGDRLALGRLANQTFVVGETDDGRGRACPFRVLDDLGLAAVHDGDAAVGGAEVDADDFAHVLSIPSCLQGDSPRRRTRNGIQAPVWGEDAAEGTAPAPRSIGI